MINLKNIFICFITIFISLPVIAVELEQKPAPPLKEGTPVIEAKEEKEEPEKKEEKPVIPVAERVKKSSGASRPINEIYTASLIINSKENLSGRKLKVWGIVSNIEKKKINPLKEDYKISSFELVDENGRTISIIYTDLKKNVILRGQKIIAWLKIEMIDSNTSITANGWANDFEESDIIKVDVNNPNNVGEIKIYTPSAVANSKIVLNGRKLKVWGIVSNIEKKKINPLKKDYKISSFELVDENGSSISIIYTDLQNNVIKEGQKITAWLKIGQMNLGSIWANGSANDFEESDIIEFNSTKPKFKQIDIKLPKIVTVNELIEKRYNYNNEYFTLHAKLGYIDILNNAINLYFNKKIRVSTFGMFDWDDVTKEEIDFLKKLKIGDILEVYSKGMGLEPIYILDKISHIKKSNLKLPEAFPERIKVKDLNKNYNLEGVYLTLEGTLKNKKIENNYVLLEFENNVYIRTPEYRFDWEDVTEKEKELIKNLKSGTYLEVYVQGRSTIFSNDYFTLRRISDIKMTKLK